VTSGKAGGLKGSIDRSHAALWLMIESILDGDRDTCLPQQLAPHLRPKVGRGVPPSRVRLTTLRTSHKLSRSLRATILKFPLHRGDGESPPIGRHFNVIFKILRQSRRSPNDAMITFLHGKLIEALPTQVTLEVNGVGYEVLIPLSSFDKLPMPGGSVKLLTHLVVREDAHVLYGFTTAQERELFRMLINTVSGIGPKIALNILSGMNPVAFRGAVANADVKSLSQISGVGRKTAERIVVELKDRIGAAGAWEALSAQRALTAEEQKINDAVLALVALGFKQVEAHETVRGVLGTLGGQATVEDLVRACLKKGS